MIHLLDRIGSSRLLALRSFQKDPRMIMFTDDNGGGSDDDDNVNDFAGLFYLFVCSFICPSYGRFSEGLFWCGQEFYQLF